jgi:hypothetical protein
LPDFARNFLTWSVTSRPLKGSALTIDLVLGYHKANTSPLLKLFLSRVDDLVARVSKRTNELGDVPPAERGALMRRTSNPTRFEGRHDGEPCVDAHDPAPPSPALTGRLHYADCSWPVGTMSYKHETLRAMREGWCAHAAIRLSAA